MSKLMIIAGILLPGAFHPALALMGNEPLVNGTSLYLTTGQSWPFYQGYSFNLMSVSKSGDKAWVQLKLNDTVVKSAVLSRDEVFYYNSTTHYNLSNYSLETLQLSLRVSGIYTGEVADIVTFSQVYQYYDPALPEPTPTPTAYPGYSNNSSVTPTTIGTDGSGIPGFNILLTTIILGIWSIFLRRSHEGF
ncbi:MAG: S-layer protein domain-containing protein [Methanosarcinales archaeon]|nr:S-layer protein domain-containing protein [Methanosarcinales archaeon]